MSLPRPALLILGLAAIISGILAMHVWMGGHGATSHHVADTGGSGQAAVSFHGTSAAVTTKDAGQVAHTDTTLALSCADACSDGDMAMGMCVIALMVLGFLALHGVRTRCVIIGGRLRAPPMIRAVQCLPPRTPSLTQLSISRT